MMRHLFLFIFSLSFFFSVYAVDTTIEKIQENPHVFDGELVSISGIVTNFVKGENNSTSRYLLTDDFGNKMKVVTAEESPIMNKKYKVTGIVYLNQDSREPFISETRRVEFGIVNEIVVPADKEGRNSNWLLIVIAIGAVTSVVLMFVSGSKNKSANNNLKGKGVMEPENNSSDFQSIKLNAVSPSDTNASFFPGELKIISGADKAKVFKMAGYPCDEGVVVTIGRAEVKGERAFAHIQVLEQTVARQHAQLILKGKTLVVKNISETRLVMVDRLELKTNETAELKPSSIMIIGDLELQYIV